MAAAVGAAPSIAIAIDAAEPTVVRRLMADGELPALAAIAGGAAPARVASHAHIGSGTVWPTFGSAEEPFVHGVHYHWTWDPARMQVSRCDWAGVVPWWRARARAGRGVLTLDVPFLPFADLEGCVEIAEWGAHDRVRGRVEARPHGLAEELARDPGPHPFQRQPPPAPDGLSPRAAQALSTRAQAGARLRADLAVRLLRRQRPDIACIVFPEVHHASHLLWHTLQPDHPLLADRRRADADERALVDVFRAVDAGVGRIVESLPADARIVVFSMHGMRPARGVPTVLHPLLVQRGFAAVPRAGRLSPRDAGRLAFAAAKARAPTPARRAWRRAAPPAMLRAAAAPTMMRPYDWERTRAFALPSDQHGWVRVNLAGREARGIVPAACYDGLCDELTAALREARTEDGRPLVRTVVRVAEEHGGSPPTRLPDLVVHWEDAAHDVPVRVAGSDIAARPDGLRLTGQHAFDGFLVSSGVDRAAGDVRADELHRLMEPS